MNQLNQLQQGESMQPAEPTNTLLNPFIYFCPTRQFVLLLFLQTVETTVSSSTPTHPLRLTCNPSLTSVLSAVANVFSWVFQTNTARAIFRPTVRAFIVNVLLEYITALLLI